jgi:ABC-type dipeptide/oligopeptide/nickel transport system ATPase component
VVAELADEVHVMNAGRIVESGPVGELFADPAHACTRRLLRAAPTENVAPAREGDHG